MRATFSGSHASLYGMNLVSLGIMTMMLPAEHDIVLIDIIRITYLISDVLRSLSLQNQDDGDFEKFYDE